MSADVNLADCIANKAMSIVLMQEYDCHKKVHALPMNRGLYNTVRGWKIPENENPSDDGYLVVYNRGTDDEYVSWSPKHVFDDGCKERNGNMLDFGDAVRAMKQGKQVARAGWNGSGMYAVLMNGYPDGVPANKETASKHRIEEGEIVKIRPYYALFTAQKDVASWAPSGSDTLAEDWYIVK